MINKKYMILICIFSVLFFTACTSEKQEEKTVIVKESDIVQKTIGVKGLTCVGCEVTLEKAISKLDGVVKVKASATQDNAIVEYDKTKTDEEDIIHSIKRSGYKPFPIIDKK